MSPEEKTLLERTLKLSEENNQILRKMQSAARWARVWGFIKIAFVVVPLIVGYVYLEPYLDQAVNNFKSVQELINQS